MDAPAVREFLGAQRQSVAVQCDVDERFGMHERIICARHHGSLPGSRLTQEQISRCANSPGRVPFAPTSASPAVVMVCSSTPRYGLPHRRSALRSACCSVRCSGHVHQRCTYGSRGRSARRLRGPCLQRRAVRGDRRTATLSAVFVAIRHLVVVSQVRGGDRQAQSASGGIACLLPCDAHALARSGSDPGGARVSQDLGYGSSPVWDCRKDGVTGFWSEKVRAGYCLTMRGKARAACFARFSRIGAHDSHCPRWLVTTSDVVGVHSLVTDAVSLARQPSRKGVANNVFNYFNAITKYALKEGLPMAAETVSGVGVLASIVRGVCAL